MLMRSKAAEISCDEVVFEVVELTQVGDEAPAGRCDAKPITEPSAGPSRSPTPTSASGWTAHFMCFVATTWNSAPLCLGTQFVAEIVIYTAQTSRLALGTIPHCVEYGSQAQFHCRSYIRSVAFKYACITHKM